MLETAVMVVKVEALPRATLVGAEMGATVIAARVVMVAKVATVPLAGGVTGATVVTDLKVEAREVREAVALPGTEIMKAMALTNNCSSGERNAQDN
jgi:hypothetical protein